MVECRVHTILIFNILYLSIFTWVVWLNFANTCTTNNELSDMWNNQESVSNLNSIMIKRYYHPPSNGLLNLSYPNKYDFSQLGQSEQVNKWFFKNMTNGFFFEVGAYDGEEMSNTLMFERFYNWTGILVEANPILFEQMLAKNRNAHMFNLCLGKSGGFVTLKKKIIPCVSIREILTFLAVKHIDYVVLDVENDKDFLEPEIMLDLDFDHISYGLFQIEVSWHREHNFMPSGSLRYIGKDVDSQKEMERYYFAKRFMKMKNFELKAVTSIDMIYGSTDGPYQRLKRITA